MTTALASDPRPVDTLDADLAKLENLTGFRALMTTVSVPENLAKIGYESLTKNPPMWGIRGDWQYIYKPLVAWDAAQRFADELIKLTGGHVFTFVAGMFQVIRVTAELEPAEGQTDDDLTRERVDFFGQQSRKLWASLLDACPNFAPNAWAQDVIKRCDVRRIPSPAEQAKADDDPTKDLGGPIFSVQGAGEVGRFYRGNRDQIVRLALAAAWGSVGDFFVPR